jgi:D-glycero-alpha-D-manno-heptose 1-phosphate guanylyltransferase
MSIKALVLAGGLGTRLRSVVSNVPKSLAEINGQPFLKYLLEHIFAAHIVDEIILAVGYKGEMIIDAIGNSYKGIKISYATEETPLGTGGAIKNALSERHGAEHFFIFNGDTFANLNLTDFLHYHLAQQADITIASLEMKEFDRYGSISLDSDGRIIKFNEKKHLDVGLISCGIYLISQNFIFTHLLNIKLESFSIEKDVFEKVTSSTLVKAFVSNHYFIDIGVPEDYERAQREFKHFSF